MADNLFSNFPIKKNSGEEQVLFTLHRHWFNILSQFLIVFVILVLLLAAFFLSPIILTNSSNPAVFTFFLFIENIFILIAWIYSFLVWIDYYFDVWIVTSERIINIEQKGLFVRHVSELDYKKIQDLTVEIEGFLPTVLNYGDLFIQTAGEQNRFVFRQIPDPHRIKSEVMNLTKQRGHHL